LSASGFRRLFNRETFFVQIAQFVLSDASDSAGQLALLQAPRPNLVLAFGSAPLLRSVAAPLATAFPAAHRMGCSTAGEISAAGVGDNSCVVTAVRLDSSTLVQATTRLADTDDSFAAGQRLARRLPERGLRAVIVLGQGVRINGCALLRGMNAILGSRVPVTGGLAGDGSAFRETWVLNNDGLSNDAIVALGLYGDRLDFCHASYGGWSPFGPVRKVTRSVGSVLYELDGEPALAVYKRYLGEHAEGLPASGLLFPFAMLGDDHREIGLIRTILGVDEVSGGLTLGEIEQGGYVKLMHANTDALVDGAETAAADALKMLRATGREHVSGLALLISCVGRKLVMGGRVDEEVEAVGAVFARHAATLAGFYSYGEISPFRPSGDCRLHNQTMTISYFSET